MGRKRKSRIYTKRGRYYGDFRDLGGKQEALVPPDSRYATTDSDVAAKIAADRVGELEQRARGIGLGLRPTEPLGRYADAHLKAKARAGRVTEGTLDASEKHLARAVEFLGEEKPIAGITVEDVAAWADHLAASPGGRGGNKTLSGQTVRHHLNSLSNLYRRAQSEGKVAPGYNPVAAMMDKPTGRAAEAQWLGPHEAALFLEAARVHEPAREGPAAPIYALLAAFLLTGGRKSEVLGLAVRDVNFERRTVTFRPHSWRRLKTRNASRVVPLWPQLEEILRDYLGGDDAPKGVLLFPGALDEERPLQNPNKVLDAAAEAAGWEPGEIRTKAFRHTYCATRLQTLDQGAPVSPFTVAREMGHGGRSLVDRVYGHLGDVRQRSEVVEYRPAAIETIPDAEVRRIFADRLAKVRGLRVA